MAFSWLLRSSEFYGYDRCGFVAANADRRPRDRHDHAYGLDRNQGNRGRKQMLADDPRAHFRFHIYRIRLLIPDMEPANMLPILDNGWPSVLWGAGQIATVPLGETIVFAMLIPYVNRTSTSDGP